MSVASCWSHFEPLGIRGISLVCRWSPWSPSSAVSALGCNPRRQDGQSHTEEAAHKPVNCLDVDVVRMEPPNHMAPKVAEATPRVVLIRPLFSQVGVGVH